MQKRYIYILFFIFSLPIYSEKKCNDLIILLDPNQNETIEARSLALAGSFLTALQEQASPIVVTSNIVKNFCFWKTEHKEILNQIKQIVSTNDKTTSEIKVQEIIKSLNPTKSATFPSYRFAIPLSIIDLSDSDWYCYIHKYNKLILLLPKKYIAQQSSKNNLDDQIEECGFQVTDLMRVNTILYESLLQQINTIENEEEVDLLSAFKSLFIVPSSSLDKSWNVYLMGHGSPAGKKKTLLEEKTFIEESYRSWQTIIDNWRYLNKPKELNRAILAAKPTVEKYNLLQSIHSLNDEDLIPQTAQIAGISFDDFFKLMNFFNTINTSFFYYTTCFGGGFNRTFINNVLKKINIRFITISEGYNESSTLSSFPNFRNTAGILTLSRTPFTNLFGMLNNFFGESISVKQTKIKQQLKKDPIATILSNFIRKEDLLSNQPFIRIPSVGVFQAIAVDKKVKIITHSIAKAYEFENHIIDLTNPEIEAVLIYPEKIKVPIHLRDNIKIISPIQQHYTVKSHVIHIFDNIKLDGWLDFLLYDFITRNNSYTKTTFIIKNLTCYSSENLKSDDQEAWSKYITITNLIIQITTDLIAGSSTNFYTSIKIAFSINQKDYSFEKSFENTALNKIDLLDFFKSSPTQPADPQLLQSLADTIDENITLPVVVKHLENKINETTSVQKVGSLKKILLLKKLDSIEHATMPQAIEQNIKWLKKKGKPLTTINERFKKYMQELSILQQNINKLIQAGDFAENEKIIVAKKISAIHENIKNVDQIIAQELSKGYFSQFIEKIKDTGQQLYQWFSSRKK